MSVARVKPRPWWCWIGIAVSSAAFAMIVTTERTVSLDRLIGWKGGQVMAVFREGRFGVTWYGNYRGSGWPPLPWWAFDESRLWIRVVTSRENGGVMAPIWMVCAPFIVIGGAAWLRDRAPVRRGWWIRRRLWQAGVFASVCALAPSLPKHSDLTLWTTSNGELHLIRTEAIWGVLWRSASSNPPGPGVALVQLEAAMARWPGFTYHPGILGAMVRNIEGDSTAYLWPAAWLILTAAPTAWLCWRTRARWVPETRCVSCGYDLAGQTSPGCPECGHGRSQAI